MKYLLTCTYIHASTLNVLHIGHSIIINIHNDITCDMCVANQYISFNYHAHILHLHVLFKHNFSNRTFSLPCYSPDAIPI